MPCPPILPDPANRQRLIRFLARDGRVLYGDAILPPGVADIGQATQARVLAGRVFGEHTVTDEVADVRLLLAPLAPEDVGTVRCLGLNYVLHAKEVRRLPCPRPAGRRTQDARRAVLTRLDGHGPARIPDSVCRSRDSRVVKR